MDVAPDASVACAPDHLSLSCRLPAPQVSWGRCGLRPQMRTPTHWTMLVVISALKAMQARYCCADAEQSAGAQWGVSGMPWGYSAILGAMAHLSPSGADPSALPREAPAMQLRSNLQLRSYSARVRCHSAARSRSPRSHHWEEQSPQLRRMSMPANKKRELPSTSPLSGSFQVPRCRTRLSLMSTASPSRSAWSHSCGVSKRTCIQSSERHFALASIGMSPCPGLA